MEVSVKGAGDLGKFYHSSLGHGNAKTLVPVFLLSLFIVIVLLY